MTTPARADGGFWAVARRPKWIAALVAVLAVAALFSLLANWQLERSIDSSAAERPDTETAVPLRTIAVPQTPMAADAFGRTVEVDLAVVPGDAVVLRDRVNHGDPGWWVVVHAVDADGASLAVAAGWAATEAEALTAAAAVDAGEELGVVTGRYLPTESPQQSDFEVGERSAIAVAELINLWSAPPDGVYGGYLILAQPLAGLEAIDAPAPSRAVEFSLLNLFYALEWILFAGFAVFLWWRLVEDEREQELAAPDAEHGDRIEPTGDPGGAPGTEP